LPIEEMTWRFLLLTSGDQQPEITHCESPIAKIIAGEIMLPLDLRQFCA